MTLLPLGGIAEENIAVLEKTNRRKSLLSGRIAKNPVTNRLKTLPSGGIAEKQILKLKLTSRPVRGIGELLREINWTGQNTHSAQNSWGKSNKVKNKIMHAANGNRTNKILKIFQWNMGSRAWTKKQDEIQLIIDEINPDLMYITEANIYKDDPEYSTTDREIYPDIPIHMDKNEDMNYARIILLIKNDLAHTVLLEHMEEDISTIWVKITRRGARKLIIGGIYREFQHLKQDNDLSKEITAQEDRWRRIIEKWEIATEGADSIVIGDMNMDFLTWNTPGSKNLNMIEKTKTTM